MKNRYSSSKRIALLMVVDYLILVLSSLWAVFLTFGRPFRFIEYAQSIMLFMAVKVVVSFIFGVYNISMKYCSLDLLIRELPLIGSDILLYLIKGGIIGYDVIPLRLYCSLTVWNYMAMCGYRIVVRMIFEVRQKRLSGGKPRALIYGAGECGRALARHADSPESPYSVVGFIDDNESYNKTIILGKRVFGNIDQLDKVLPQQHVAVLVIAISSGISAEKMQQVALTCKNHGVPVKMAPSMFELSAQGKKESFDLRSLDYADLLGRPLITIDRAPIMQMIKGKRVLVTGAGGSIGSEICRQLKSFQPKQLLLLDIDETELHNLSLELHSYQEEFAQDIFPICCDIKNEPKIREIFRVFQPQIVFHAAAYKHVPMMELYPEEAIRTNIKGSYNVLKAARDYEAEKVIVISTDKAVNPTNVMGATKRVVEQEAAMFTTERTPMVCVRFGNVIGSRGSMLPLFFDQINKGVPLTVTDKNIIRYFMAIPEAVGLVFLASAMANGGEVMVLDMGEPVKIYDFAQKLIDIYGDPKKNKIIITGLRPGEKLYEELLANKDNTIPTTNKRIFKAKVKETLDRDKFERMMDTIMMDPVPIMMKHLEETIPEYTPKAHKSWQEYTEA